MQTKQIKCVNKMDMFLGWPFYRPGGDPGYGCYGPGSYPSRGQSFYGYPSSDPFFNDPFFSDPEWYPEVSHFPFHRLTFHRPSRHCSPFTGPAGTAHLSQGEVTIHLRIGVMYIQTNQLVPTRQQEVTLNQRQLTKYPQVHHHQQHLPVIKYP